MPLYEVTADNLAPLRVTSLADHSVREREGLQRLLRDRIEVLETGLLVIAEEFSEWEESRRRIDLLALDRNANLVVIELKRDAVGAHMELQALRYAAMVSTLTFERTVEIFQQYLDSRDLDAEAEDRLLEFLDWEEPDEDAFGQDTRILLASADFGRELTTAVLWLNERDLDIRCVRLEPYTDGSRLFLNAQQVIPLPEAQEFQVRVREKARKERNARTSTRDLTRYDVVIRGERFTNLAKRVALWHIVRHLIAQGYSPEEISAADLTRPHERVWRIVDGTVGEEEFNRLASEKREGMGLTHEPRRFYCSSEELVHHDGKTYAFTKMWGGEKWMQAMRNLQAKFRDEPISFEPSA